MTQFVETEPRTVPKKTPEAMAGAGFTDWQRVAQSLGEHTLSSAIDWLSPENFPDGVNPHRAIADKLRLLDLPVQAYTHASVSDFLARPEYYLALIPDGEYYFVSIKPGTHLAHGNSEAEVVDFVRRFTLTNPDASSLNQEMYISHNGEPVMSGHIIIKDDGSFNNIYSEFTIGNFNAFHRGSHSPEIILRRPDHKFEWEFRNALDSQGDDWRTQDSYTCNGGADLTRPEMAQRAYDALTRIPRDGNYYLPGYYEVLLERTQGNQTWPVFIEASVPGLR